MDTNYTNKYIRHLRVVVLLFIFLGFQGFLPAQNDPFEPVPPTGLPYNIVLSGLDINGQALPIGTQIGVFDGELCVGDAFYNGEGNLNLVAWEADPGQNLAGFTAGNTMSFKFHVIWHSETRNFDAGANYDKGDGTFGHGAYSVAALSVVTSLIPDFSISGSQLNFNTVVVNESSSLPLVIQNNGTAILYVSSIQNDDNHFTTSAQSLLIGPAEWDTLWVTFIPTEVIAYTDLLVMNTDDPDTPLVEIPLYGTGLPQPTPQISVTPSSLDFGGIAMNTSSTLNLNIYNAGNGTLEVTGITSTDPAFGVFGNTSFSLEQGENTDVAVVFAPTESGAFTGQLTILNNDQQVLVPVSGVASQGHFTGVDPTGKPYTVVVEDIDIDGFRPVVGDEVAVFDGGLCVGVGVASTDGNSLALDGSGDYLINDNSSAFDLQHLTISAWVYSSSFNQNGFIFEKGPVNSQYSLFFEGSNINFRTFPVGASGYDNFYNNSSGIGITNNEWHFITATYDGVQKRIYVDGVLKASQDYSKMLRTGQVGQIIGAYGGSGGHSYYFNGNIDEVRVWDYARTLEEIQYDMFHELAPNEQGLAGYWNFDNANFNNLVSGSTPSTLNGNANLGGAQNSEILSNIVITAWEKDDELGLPGFTAGNPISFKVWTEIYDNWVEVDAVPDFIVGNGNFGFGQMSVVTLEGATGLEPNILVPIESIYVGQVTVGEFVVNEITVHNTGNAPLHISVSDNSDAFNSSITTEVIPETDSITFEVTFTPATPGGYSAELTIESNDPDEPEIVVGLEGFALPAGAVDIATSVDHLTFGDVIVDSTKINSFFVINTGTSPLIVSDISSSDEVFSASPSSFTLQNTNDLMEVFVNFTPSNKGAFIADLTINSNAAAKQLGLEGIGFDNHFNIVDETGLPYIIVVDQTNLDEFIMPGDELSVFDGGLCVGMANTAALLHSQDLTIVAWEKDDENGLPGFTPGNEMSFKIWTEINGIPSELTATPTYTIGDGTFGFGQFTVVGLEFDLPGIIADPMEFFVALEEPDSTERVLTITNNGESALEFNIANNYSNGMFTADYYYSPGSGSSPGFGDFIFSAEDEFVDSNWGNGGPGNGVGNDDFQVKWTGLIYAETSGVYQFRSYTDDGLRLYIDGQIIIDYWNDQGSISRYGSIDLAPGQHELEFQYYENGGGATAYLYWTPPGQPEELVSAADTDWLVLSPSSGVISVSDSAEITIGFKSAGLFDGLYFTSLNIINNTLNNSPIAVPVALNVTGNPQIASSTDSLGVGKVVVGETFDSTLVLTNIGSKELLIDDIFVVDGANTGFGYSLPGKSFPVSVNPGETLNVDVSFTPQTPGQVEDTLIISSNASNAPVHKIVLTGEGITPPEIYIPETSFSHTFPCNDVYTDSIKVYNTGQEDLEIDMLGSLLWLTANPSQATVAGGDSITIQVNISTLDLFAGGHEAILAVSSNDPGQPLVEVFYFLTITGEPAILANDFLDIGIGNVGDTITGELMIANSGCDTLDILSASIESQFPVFFVVNPTFSIPPGDASPLLISFVPATTQQYSAIVTINSNDVANPALPVVLSATGVEPPNMAVLPLEIVSTLQSGNSEQKSFTVQNIGGQVLAFQSEASSLNEHMIYLDGTGDYINVVHSNPLNPSEAITLETWLFPLDNSNEFIMGKENSSEGNYRLLINGDHKFQFQLNTIHSVTSNAVAEINQWVHIAAAFDGETMSLFVNGVLDSEQTFAPFTILPNGDNLRIGRSYQYQYFNGMMDEVRVWDIARNQSEVQSTMNQSLLGTEPELLLYFPFLNSIGNIITDASTNGNNGILYGNPQRQNSSVPFDDYLTIINGSGNLSANLLQNVTLSLNSAGFLARDYQREILVSSNAAKNPSDTVSLSLTITGTGNIVPNPAQLIFEDVFIGQSDTLELILENTGASAAIVTGIFFSSDAFYSLDEIEKIFPFSQKHLMVVFEPSVIQLYNETITVSLEDAKTIELEIPLTGLGVTPPIPVFNPVVADFGNVVANNTGTVTMGLSNDGSSDLEVYSAAFSDGTFFETDILLPQTLVFEGQILFDVFFSPINYETINEELIFSTNVGLISLPVTGIGVPPDHDLSIIEVIVPQDGCGLSNSELLTVTIQNFGELSQSNFDVGFSINSGLPVEENVAVTLESGESMDYSFTQTLDLSTLGDYNLEVFSLLGTDQNTWNDTLNHNLTNSPSVGGVTGLLPADSSFGVVEPVAFLWSPVANADEYDLYLWRTTQQKPDVPTVADIASANYTYFEYLNKNYLYNWQIVARNQCSQSESDILVFSFNVFSDLTAEDILMPETAFSGDSVDVSFTITNLGVGSTGWVPWMDELYISANPDFDPENAELVSSPTNLSVLSGGQSYVNTVGIKLSDYLDGTQYFFVKVDGTNKIQETNEDNNIVRSVGSMDVTLPPYPDLFVKEVVSMSGNIVPGSTLTVGWSVENIGDADAIGGWSQKVSIVSGVQRLTLGYVQYIDTLVATGIISQSTSFNVPDYPGIDGDVFLEVELTPYAALVEKPNATANNTAISAESLIFEKLLFISIPEPTIDEDATDPLLCAVYRSGNRTEELIVDLSVSEANRINMPPTVTIPADQSGAIFVVFAVDNDLIEGDIDLELTADGPGYPLANNLLTVIDDELPSLVLAINLDEATEGDKINITITRDLVSDQALIVSLSTNRIDQIDLPVSVEIPENEVSVNFEVDVVDDNVPELPDEVIINALRTGYISGADTVNILDDDLPQLELTLNPDSISEAGGAYASWGTVILSEPADGALTILLSADPLGQLFFPQQINIPNGQMEGQFNVGAIDNGVLDGDRVVNFTASIYISSCGCGAPPESGGSVTQEITILDNDGPSLAVASEPFVVPENLENAGILTITRNTLGGDELEVTLSHNRPDEIVLPAMAIIPEGEDVVEVPFNTLDDGVEDGDQIVSVTVTADEYSTGTCWVMVSDRNLPDFVLTELELSQNDILINDTIDVSMFIKNDGFAIATDGVEVNIYKSNNASLSANDQLLGSQTTQSVLAIGDSLEITASFTIADEVGDFFIIATVNENGAMNELVGINNTSGAEPLSVYPDYNATVTVDGDEYNGSTPIHIYGVTETVAKSPAPNKPVDIYIIVSGVRRVYQVTSDENGEIDMDFYPLNGEAGDYQVGACYPNQGLSDAQDGFVLLGAKHTASNYIIWELYVGETQQKFIEIKNLSSLPLNNVNVEVVSSPPGCNLNFLPVASLPGNSYATMSYSVEASDVTDGNLYEEVLLLLTSDEGTEFQFSTWFFCSATMGNLKLLPVVLNESMVKDQINHTEFEVRNNGLDETGLITIQLPNVDWMALASPDTISSLLPGESAIVTLSLTPGDDLQLNNPITGQIALSGTNSNSVGLPFSFEPISDETGDLLVDVVDAYTYNTTAAPHVDSATVIVSHPYTGQIIAQGLSDENGHFLVEEINEGYYILKVQGQQHGGFQDYIYIEKGIVNEELVFITFQAITYSWEVIPTLIEDEYEITLITVFETNVPVPVVTMDMPDTFPGLEYGEYFPFILIMTNEGLITAQDVEVSFQEMDDYMFTVNVGELDILPQTAVQIPVVMERKPPGASGTGERGNNCTVISQGEWKFVCGPNETWDMAFTASGLEIEICAGTGGSGGGGWPWGWGGCCGGGGPGGPGGGTGTSVGPNVGPSPPYTSTTVDCTPCTVAIANAALGCGPISIPGIGPGKSRVLPFIAGAYAAYKAYKALKGAWDCGWSIGEAINECFINKGSMSSGPPPELIQAQEDLLMCDKAFTAIRNVAIEIHNGENLLEKQDYGILSDSISYNLENTEPIDHARQDELVDVFADSDITEFELLDWISYWNTTLEAWGIDIYSPTPEYPEIIDTVLIHNYTLAIDTALNYAYGRGFPSVDSLYNYAMEIVNGYINDQSSSVCATVTVQFSQTLTMTREAFEGTLTIFNGHETDAMQNILLDFEVRDEEGILRNDLFQINTQSLNEISGIDGSGILNALVEGTAVILFIPERGAAPDVPRYYSFGGTLSYLDPFTGEIFEQGLFPVTLQVNPSPNLYLNYFMQRDILGDDALTLDRIEPMIPAELAVMIDNQGAGTAMNVNLESAQPEIIENEKGLLIDFEIIGSNLGGQPVQLGIMDVDFGDIPGGEIAVGQWWFTSTLLGHFISYEASVKHLDSYGNPDLSLVSGIEIHELIKSITVYGPLNDSIDDFLVNDLPDTDDIPDAIYYSNGAIAQVVEAESSVTDGPVNLNDTVVELTVTPSAEGWNYTKLNDPGNGLYRIVSCTRNADGQEIPLKNIWLTYSTIPDGGEPIYENKLHFVDIFDEISPSTYTVVFEPIDQDVPEVIAINGIPEEPTDIPVTNVEVVFSEPIEPTTFNYEDMTLKNQGGPNLMDTLVIVTQVNDSTFDVDISDKTHPNGYYTLAVQAAGVADLVGNYGNYGVQVGWLQAIATPAIDYFIGLPEEPGGPIDTLLVLFNMPINEATFTTDQLTLTDNNGDPVPTESLIITSESFNNVLFKISGLEPLNPDDGDYELSFKLTEIQGENGQIGVLDQSIGWTVCQIPLPIANAGDDGSMCVGENYQLDGTVENASSFIWSTNGTGSFDDDQILTPTYAPGQEDIDAGVIEVTLTAEPLNECAAATSSSLTLTIESSVEANAGDDATICEDDTYQLFGTLTNASGFAWLSSGDGSFDNDLILTPVYTPGTEDAVSGSVELSLIALPLSPCILADTSTIVLSVQKLPVSDAGDNITVCENQSVQLLATATNYGSLVWLSSGDGTFDNREILDPVYTPGPNDALLGFANLALLAQATSPCFYPNISVVRVNFDKLPVAFAGMDATVCENQSHQLNGFVLYQSSFTWETSGDGIFDDDQILNPVYAPGSEDLQNGFVGLSLTAEPISPCEVATTSTMILNIQKVPTADAGQNALICENQTHQLAGTVENAESFMWQTAGDGAFDNTQILNPVYSPGPDDITNGSVELSLLVNPVSPCVASDISFVTLNIQALPIANAGDDAVICANQTYQLSGTVANAGSFQWATSGDGMFDDVNVLDAVYAPGSTDIQNSTVDLSLTAQPVSPCAVSDVSVLTLDIQWLPVSSAGDDATICEDQSHQLSGTVENAESFIWETSGDGSFDDNQSLVAVYTPGLLDIQGLSVELILTVEPIGPCLISDVSTLMLTVQILPSANAGGDATICHDENHLLNGSAENSGPVLWSTNGDGSFDDPNSVSTTYTPGENDLSAGEVILTITAEALSPCATSATDQMNLIIDHCQDLTIPTGWLGVSSYVEPVDAGMETIFQDVIDDLIILQSQTGIFWPGQNVNTIGSWNILEGYSIKVSNEISLTIAGSRSATNSLQLSSGWNLIPVLSSCDVDVETLFAATNVVIVKEVAGWGIFWPNYNINNLGVLQSGKAYFVLMDDVSEIIFPECVPGASAGTGSYNPDIKEIMRSTPWDSFSTSPNTHIIGLPLEAMDRSVIRPGDILGVFDQSGNCFGATLWDNENTTMTVFGDDVLTEIKDGFMEGDDLYFRIFVATTQKVYELEVAWNEELPDYDGLFSANGLSAIQSLKLGATEIYETGGNFDALIYPNPASDKVYIDLEKAVEINVVLYDIHGQEVLQQQLHDLRNQLDISHLRSGVYLIKLEGEEIMKVERLVKK